MDEETALFAERYLNETEANRAACLAEIKSWLKDRGDLHARTEDAYLLAFLRGCKFDVEKTKKKLTNYYTMRRNVPEWFDDRDPRSKTVQDLVNLGVFVPLRSTQDKRLVVIIRVAVHDPDVHKQDDVFKTGNMLMDVAALEDVVSAQIYGVTAVFDLAGVDFRHAKQLTPAMIKKAVFSWRNYHVRPKQLEFVNVPGTVGVVLSIFKSFMSEKMRNRVRVHSSGLESLHGVIDKGILPPEYGGTGESVKQLVDYWREKLLSYTDWFIEDQKYKAD
ncbi:unnamed protein product [Phyllotreta striolata]|uniref:CRAL-TRIO domain-containing protein n=1 Tax=Phyllotreta striolata TaxID=444603 RepID=A0A9N9XX14_PHYSR|nr:unnamed protein product [Phyllotreta striolata]